MQTIGERLAQSAAKMEPTDDIVTSGGSGPQQLLKADPKRIYVEFRPGLNAAFPVPYFGSSPPSGVGTVTTTSVMIYKQHDTPGLVTGEWWINSTDALASIRVITDSYQGD